MNFYRFFFRIRHLLISSHRNGHGIHSPAIYKLIVSLWGNKNKSILVSNNTEEQSQELQVYFFNGSEPVFERLRIDRIGAFEGISPKYVRLFATIAESLGREDIAGQGRRNLCYISGCEDYDSVMKLFQIISKEDTGNTIIILDNTDLNREMRKAWLELTRSASVTVSLEFSGIGVLLSDKRITPGRYVVRY